MATKDTAAAAATATAAADGAGDNGGQVVLHGFTFVPFSPITYTREGKVTGQSEYATEIKDLGGDFYRPNDADNPARGREVIYVKATREVIVAGTMPKGGKYVIYDDTVLDVNAPFHRDTWGNHCKRAIAILKARRAAATTAPAPVTTS